VHLGANIGSRYAFMISFILFYKMLRDIQTNIELFGRLIVLLRGSQTGKDYLKS